MANDVSERPRFFEGMYLGAADLGALLDYLRGLTRRHELGGHSWGIGAGLELVERETPAGAIEAWITPGWAIDGYGRQIVLFNAYKLSPGLFAGRVGLVPVWLRYVETGSQGLRPGFEVCGADDTYARTAEGFAVEVGDMPLAGQQNQGVMLDGVVRDEPRLAVRSFDPAAGLVCDTSLPQQAFMDAGSLPRWLVPIGKALLSAGGSSAFQKRDAGQLRESRLVRRPVGVIAESVLGAEGVLRLRGRMTPADANKSAEEVCEARGIKATDFDITSGRPVAIDGIWLEENTRVTGQCKLFGTRLEFRDEMGSDKGVPLYLRRGESANNPLAGQDLQIILGGTGDGKDRLAVGTAQNFGAISEKVIVRSNGQVGIGTNAPDRAVTVLGPTDTFINVKANNGLQELLLGADGDGAVVSAATNHDLLLRAGGNSTKVWVKASGAVGIGTNLPDRKVTISDAANCYLNVLANGGAQQVLLGADGNGGIVSTMTNHDLVLRSGGNATRVWIKADGKIGIGTSVPDRALTVSGPGGAYINARADDGSAEVLLGADGGGGIVSTMSNQDLQLRAGANNTRVWVKANGRVGIGTSAPAQILDVVGNARKSVGGDRWQFVSDARLKTNVAPVTGALRRLLELRGVTFDWRDPPEGTTTGPHLGFIAQDVEPVFPEWVSEGEDGRKCLNISGFEAVLIEALREVKGTMDDLAARLDKLEAARSPEAARPPTRAKGGSTKD